MSKVYFANLRTDYRESMPDRLKRLIHAAGIDTIDFTRKFTAIKMHFGEPGNVSYLRPNYAKAVADVVRELGGFPFLTDCSTLYPGRRKNALDHLDAAYENGFSPFSTGCQIIAGDGLKGTDDVEVEINGDYVKSAKIGRAIMDADVFISLNHFKGHEATGFGGALKNIGMGCGSKGGKMEMHCSGKPAVRTADCRGCALCLRACAHDAITLTAHKAAINHDACVGCGRCIGQCPFHVISGTNDSRNEDLNAKIAEYTYAVIKDRPNFHINLVVDVSPRCDCYGANDAAIVPDIGMFASFDPVALDVACADAVNRQPAISGSVLGANRECGGDKFTHMHPETDWRSCIAHAEKIGCGSSKYTLIEL